MPRRFMNEEYHLAILSIALLKARGEDTQELLESLTEAALAVDENDLVAALIAQRKIQYPGETVSENFVRQSAREFLEQRNDS